MYMAMSWYAFQVLVLIFTFFHLIFFFPCTFFVSLSPFSYCTTVISNMATNKWYIYSIISQYMQSYWFSKQSKISMIYNISVIIISLTMSIILANFGKYAISDCPFICLSVCLSVSLSVLSSITHERFDISSPNLVHIWNGWAVPVCDIDK